MGDLISRRDALELLYKIFDKYRMSTDKNTSIGKSFGTDVFEEIRNMPTAYDIDKVVEELDKASDYYECEEQGREHVQMVDLTEAIEIVKQGGVSDDVCEAKQGRWVFDKFTAKYGKPYRCNCCSEEFGDTYKYCPNCGVSMKEVE